MPFLFDSSRCQRSAAPCVLSCLHGQAIFACTSSCFHHATLRPSNPCHLNELYNYGASVYSMCASTTHCLCRVVCSSSLRFLYHTTNSNILLMASSCMCKHVPDLVVLICLSVAHPGGWIDRVHI